MFDPNEMEQIRIDIWDYIYQTGPSDIRTLAEELNLPEDSVRDAVANAWFDVADEMVSNAVVS
ncbi:MAG: hypothetical protein U0905_15780 [Pirellulales bacterium]